MAKRTGKTSMVLWLMLGGIGAGVASVGLSRGANEPAKKEPGRVVAQTPVEAGEYLVRICGCNDCHTAGFSQSGGKVPMEKWLIGTAVGYRGPWGTTYASNLRLYVDPMSEEDWVRITRERHDKPPMPWESLHAMSDPDLRAVYRFIKSLGKAGEKTPNDVPPGEEPKTPFAVLAPPTMPGK